MKRLILLSALLLTGCTHTEFTEYRGESVVEGKGGTVKNVDGIDFWENRDPDRKYQILGVVEDSRGDSIFSGSSRKALAKAAKENGGHAVVVLNQSRELSGFHQGNARYCRTAKVAVVKYLE